MVFLFGKKCSITSMVLIQTLLCARIPWRAAWNPISWAPAPEFLIQLVWCGARGFALLARPQVMHLLLVPGLHSGEQSHKYRALYYVLCEDRLNGPLITTTKAKGMQVDSCIEESFTKGNHFVLWFILYYVLYNIICNYIITSVNCLSNWSIFMVFKSGMKSSGMYNLSPTKTKVSYVLTYGNLPCDGFVGTKFP